MTFVRRIVFLLLLASSAATTVGQEATDADANEGVTEERAEKNLNFLPAPLQAVRCNVRALEATGYFTIDDVVFRTGDGKAEQVAWTVRVEKPVTCRHIEAMLRERRDLRFYETIDKRRLEIMSSLLHYSQRVSLGSANNQLLGQDDVFEVWIELSGIELRKLKSQRADRLVFGRWKY